MVDRPAAERIDPIAADDEAFFLIKRDRPRIIGVDVEIKPARRYTLCLGNERAGKPFAPIFRRDDDLVEIKRAWVGGDKADHFVAGFGHRNGRGRDQAAPLAPVSTPAASSRRGAYRGLPQTEQAEAGRYFP